MTLLARPSLLAVLDSVASGTDFSCLRRFVFDWYEAELDLELTVDLERVFAALAPYLEHEEALGDAHREVRVRRLREALSGRGRPVERTVFALEFDRVLDLLSRFDTGLIARDVYATQMRQLSPADFDIPTVMRWAEAHRGRDAVDQSLLTES